MAFNIDHETSSRDVSVDSLNEGIDDIFLSRKDSRREEPSYIPETNELEDSDIEFVANEERRVAPESESGYQDSQLSESPLSEAGSGDYHTEQESYESIQQQKAYYLSQIKRLESKGFLSQRRFGMEHSLSDIKGEAMRMKKEIEVNRGISYCKQAMMFCVSSMEMFNNRYDPFGIDLDGWSSVMMQNQNNYDDVFERLYEKYHTKISVAPEVELIFMIGGSAAMFAYQKQMTKNFITPRSPKMRGPSMDPDELLRQMSDDSDISSIASSEDIKIKVPQPKKRGRKPKAK